MSSDEWRLHRVERMCQSWTLPADGVREWQGAIPYAPGYVFGVPLVDFILLAAIAVLVAYVATDPK